MTTQTMTRNEYIAQTAQLLFVHQTEKDGSPLGTDMAVFGAEVLTRALEAQGCAPWQDAPVSAPLQFDFPETPTRREITAADVVPGAVFTDEDINKWAVWSVDGKSARIENGTREIASFVETMNRRNATVTPPAQ